MVQQNPKKTKKKQVKKKLSPEEMFEQSQTTSEPIEKIGTQTVEQAIKQIENPPITTDQKTEILGRGLVFVIWTNTLLFSGVLILVALMYQYPLNYIILGMAIVMDIIAVGITRKYMKPK